jgi:hypothetical protein
MYFISLNYNYYVIDVVWYELRIVININIIKTILGSVRCILLACLSFIIFFTSFQQIIISKYKKYFES